MWSGCEKVKGQFRVRMWTGDPVLLGARTWAPGVLVSRVLPGPWCFMLQWKSGSLTSNILLPPSACLQVTRNEAVLVCSSSKCSLSPWVCGHDLMRESFPRQVDKKSGGPQGERGLEFSRKKKGQAFFFPPSFPLHSLYNNNVSCLKTVCGKNLLANPVILKCKLWE